MCTLSAAGGDLLHCFPAGVEAPLFDVLVVDEAAQALEPATLIPMQMLKPGKGLGVVCGVSRLASGGRCHLTHPRVKEAK